MIWAEIPTFPISSWSTAMTSARYFSRSARDSVTMRETCLYLLGSR